MSCSPSVLYDRWLTTVSRHGSEVALIEASTGHTASYQGLAERLSGLPIATEPVVADAKGMGFVLDTLRAWRDGVALVPVEPGTTFDVGLLDGLPLRVAHVKQTSGTTGEPQLVLFDAAQMAADADQIVQTMGLLNHRKNVGVISLAHSYGFSNLVLPLLLHGIPLVLVDGPIPTVVELALREAGNDAILPAVPAMWQAWAKAGILDRDQIGLAISAGAPLSLDLEAEMLSEFGVKAHNFLGSSECGGIAYDGELGLRRDGQRVGTPLNGVKLELAEGGSLVVRSDAVGLGYWPVSRGDILGGGTFVTSDIAAIDSDGGVRLLGRAGDAINVAGRKVSPAEVEGALAVIEGVKYCVVFGVPSSDPQRVEEIVVCVNSNVGESDLRSALAQRVSPWKIPRHWWLKADLEPNTRGKISRREWRERFLATRR